MFSKEGYSDHQTYLKQLYSPFFGGNVFLGGIIGMAVDVANGSAYMLFPANAEMDMASGTAREFKEEDKDKSSTAAAGLDVPPSATSSAGAAALMPNASLAAPPRSAPVAPTPAAFGAAGLGGGVPLILNGVAHHPETGKAVDCQVLLAWKLEERSDGAKSAAFNREIGGNAAVLTGLTPQQRTAGMAIRDACQQTAALAPPVMPLPPTSAIAAEPPGGPGWILVANPRFGTLDAKTDEREYVWALEDHATGMTIADPAIARQSLPAPGPISPEQRLAEPAISGVVVKPRNAQSPSVMNVDSNACRLKATQEVPKTPVAGSASWSFPIAGSSVPRRRPPASSQRSKRSAPPSGPTIPQTGRSVTRTDWTRFGSAFGGRWNDRQSGPAQSRSASSAQRVRRLCGARGRRGDGAEMGARRESALRHHRRQAGRPAIRVSTGRPHRRAADRRAVRRPSASAGTGADQREAGSRK